MKSTELDIYTFTDYRAYLIAHCQLAKERNARWSMGSWATQLALSDKSSIAKIVAGQRNPGPQMTEALIKYFKFNVEQSLYFKDLIRLHKIQSDPRLSVALLEKMGKKFPDGAVKMMNGDEFEYISNWYCTAIREMTALNDFVEDADWITKKFRFKVTSQETKRAIKILLDTGLLGRDESGELELRVQRLSINSSEKSYAIRKYHKQALEHASEALDSIDTNEREFGAITLVMNRSNFVAAKELAQEFNQKFCKLFEEGTGDSLYRFQFQLFPLTYTENSNEKMH